MFEYPKIYIYAEKTIQWAFKASYPNCYIISNFKLFQSCTNKDFILMQIQSPDKLKELLWENIRIQWQKLSPVIVLGYQSEKNFINDPINLVFQERPYEYRYLSLPFCLKKLLRALTQMQPIYDIGTLKSQIRRYASLKGIIKTHLHHVNNFIYRNDLVNCGREFQQIQKLLLISALGEIKSEIEHFVKKPSNSRAKKIKILIEELINEK